MFREEDALWVMAYDEVKVTLPFLCSALIYKVNILMTRTVKGSVLNAVSDRIPSLFMSILFMI